MDKTEKKCLICENIFIPKQSNQKYCSLTHKYNCPICNKEVEKINSLYNSACDKICGAKLHKKRSLEKYGEDHPFKLQKYKNKFNKTMQFRYGVNWSAQSTEIFGKVKETNLDKYGCEFPLQNEKIKNKTEQTILDRYGVKNVLILPENREKMVSEKSRQKRYNSLKENGTFNSSKPEERAYKKLTEVYSEVNRQHKSEAYPFNCDFYIPEEDLYIECNYHWTHGTEPFDKDNLEHLKLAKSLKAKAKDSKYYKIAYNVWTNLDVRKLEIAKDNNLNYLVFYSDKEFEECLLKITEK